MGSPVVHFEVLGTDGEKLKSYYSEMFGWEITSDNPMNYGVIDREQNLNSDGIGIGGGIMGMDGDSSYVTVYVEVDDCEAALAKAEELGGKRVMGPDEVPGQGIRIGQFEDPEGHMMGVLENLG
ncbi:MAG TPA: VOC family protein [Solirubrobacterales bacterium]|nr:VOC family protein [Solirubrobacterales bacterium]